MIKIAMAYMLVFSLLFCMAEDKGEIELKEVPSLGYSYSAMPGGSTYVCYKDILILKNDVYHTENGSYVKTDETLSDMFGVKNLNYHDYRQYKNLIVTFTADDKAFLLYDMDTKRVFNYSILDKDEDFFIINWYLYDGYLYYHGYGKKEIRKIHLSDGEEQVIYSGEKGIREFAMRGDGQIFCQRWDGIKREYYLIKLEENGKWKEKKIWETEEYRWKYVEWWAFNQYGLFQAAERHDGKNGEDVIIRENGTVETFDIKVKGSCNLYLDKGCLMSNVPYSDEVLSDAKTYNTYYLRRRVSSVTFYDYAGNGLMAYQLVDPGILQEGYYMRKLLYYDGKITAIYTQKDTGELYIAQVEAEGLQ